MKDKKMIGFILTVPEFVRKEYLSKKKKHNRFLQVEIHSDKNYGAVAKLYERNSFMDRYKETTTKAERKEFSDSLSKSFNDNKRVDTSKWVKPDEESIRNALIESLFALEILKEDSNAYKEYHGKAKVLYSILHSHSPKNPQSLGNYGIDPYFEKIMDELKCPVSKKYWADFDKDFKKKNKTKDHWKKERKDYQIWKVKCLKKMIIPDPNPPKYEDIFKRVLKDVSKESKAKAVSKNVKQKCKDIFDRQK